MHVLLATDGSTFSKGAGQVLSTFPFAEKPQVTIAHVCPSADLRGIDSITDQVHQLIDDCRSRGQQLLQAAAEYCRPWAGSVETVLLDGHPATSLLHEAEQRRPDVIVIGARGLGGMSRMLLGSTSERLVKHAPCSVLVTHPPEGSTGIHRILVADDGSPTAQAAVQRFGTLAPDASRSITVLGILEREILEMIQGYGGEVLSDAHRLTDAEHKAVEDRLEKSAEVLRASTANVQVAIHKSAEVAGDILDTAVADKSDLIVIGSHGQSAWERFLLGSVPLRVLHYTPCSVWIERTPGR